MASAFNWRNKAVFPLLAVALLVSQGSCGDGSDPTIRTFDLTLASEAKGDQYEKLRVIHNDLVILHVMSEEEGTLHLHGYDLEIPLEPDVTSTLEFKAVATGKFDLEMHVGSLDHKHDEQQHCRANIPEGGSEPEIRMTINPTSKNGEFNVMVETKHFLLANTEDGSGLPTGHWHLAVDDEMKGMYTHEEVLLVLDEGEHKVMASLADLRHCEYSAIAMETVRVEGATSTETNHDKAAENQDMSHESESSNVIIGSLEVLPR